MEYSEEGKEVLEAPKTSEVKTDVKTGGKFEGKTEEEMKDVSEVATTVDEDQRKLFVGGLAQVHFLLKVAKIFYDAIHVTTTFLIFLGGERH